VQHGCEVHIGNPNNVKALMGMFIRGYIYDLEKEGVAKWRTRQQYARIGWGKQWRREVDGSRYGI
jgi:hypothetical protein